MHYSGWLKRCVPSDGCLVVNYHGVIPTDPYCRHPFLDANLVSLASLRKHLRFLRKNYNIVEAERFRGWLEKRDALPPRSVLVTCDDGLVNTLSDMLPVLQGEAVPCLFFVTGESCREEPGMLQELAKSGMSIGAHTMSHPVLSQCNEDEARREINESKTELERVLGQTVWAFAYPFGNPATMGEREVNLAREAGFECAFVNVGGGTVDPSQRFALARTHVTADMSLAEFEAHLSGFHTRLQAAVRARLA
jgi:peptidoglycan/xylan/chitin deacetylase (PgdA/CDA1 family)